MEPDEESNYTPEEKATYQKIKDYVKDKYGVNVHTSYIAQVKRMCGLDMGENYNKSKKENHFFYYEGTIILTNGFVKKTQKTPKEEIQIAKDRRKDFIERVMKDENI